MRESTLRDDYLIPNGIDAETGEYLRPRLTLCEIAKAAREQQVRWKIRLRGLAHGVDARNLEQAGWGVVYAEGSSAEKRKLSKLLDHRKRQASPHYGEFVYKAGESPLAFTRRHRLPYYLLLVGPPEAIPFFFQYQLDMSYAVGRVAFETLEGYADYARNVVEVEESQDSERRNGEPRIDLFGPHHKDDELSHLSAEQLVKPLASALRKTEMSWTVKTWLGSRATKKRLASLLGDDRPDLLFSAGHGLGFQAGDRRQARRQGSLLCYGWPGPVAGRGKAISADHYFCGDDLAREPDLGGLISFHFACFSAGTPRRDSFFHLNKKRKQLAPRSLVAYLPQRLLAAGALAVVGHVDTAWPCSFHWQGFGDQLQPFEHALSDLMRGFPVGAAMDSFGQRSGELATEILRRREDDLIRRIEGRSSGRETGEAGDGPSGVSDEDLDFAFLWLANNDARTYTVLGDPAVRLRV